MTLRGALIGCGFVAVNQMHGRRDMRDTEIVAVCDRDPERLRIVGEQFGIASRHTGAAAMLAAETLDFVDIATTVGSHRPLVELAAQHGIPVICQKPFALSPSRCATRSLPPARRPACRGWCTRISGGSRRSRR